MSTDDEPWAVPPVALIRAARADMLRVRSDYQDEVGIMQLAHWDRRGYTSHLGSAAGLSYRDGVWAGIRLVLNAQHTIDDLTYGELLAELRKGNGSIYAPLMGDKISAECPRCDRLVLIDVEGICPECTYEFQEID